MNMHAGIFLLYHGTNAEFTAFDNQYKGSNTEYENTIHGFFFAEKAEHARIFGTRIIEARVTLNKVMDLRIQGIFSIKAQASIIWEILSGEIKSNNVALRALNEDIDIAQLHQMYEDLNTKKSNDILRNHGYDGILSSLGPDEKEYVAFNIEQIEQLKSYQMERTVKYAFDYNEDDIGRSGGR